MTMILLNHNVSGKAEKANDVILKFTVNVVKVLEISEPFISILIILYSNFVQVVLILPFRGQGPTNLSQSISWQVMTNWQNKPESNSANIEYNR